MSANSSAWKEYLFGVFRTDPREIASLNGIRSIAIFMLFYVHLFRFLPNVDRSMGLIRNFLDNGSESIDMFFVLSGFLISGPLMRQLARKGTLDLKNFYIKRSLRIFPPYFIFCAIMYFYVIPKLYGGTDALGEKRSLIIYDLLYVSNYFHGTIFHGWSLSLEEQFYLLFPILLLIVFPLLKKTGRLVFLLCFTAIPLIFRLLFWHFAILPASPIEQIDLYNSHIYYPFHGHYDSIFIGILLAYFYDNYRPLVDGLYERPIVFQCVQWFAWLGILAYSLFVFEFEAAIASMVIRFPIFSTLWALVIVTSMKPGTVANRLLSFRIYSPIAKLSYCAYLIHVAIMSDFMRTLFLDKNTQTWIYVPQWQVFPYSILMGFVILFFAYLYHLVAERPFMILKEKYAGKQISFEQRKA